VKTFIVIVQSVVLEHTANFIQHEHTVKKKKNNEKRKTLFAFDSSYTLKIKLYYKSDQGFVCSHIFLRQFKF